MRDDVRARRGSQQVNNEPLEPEYEIVDWIGLYWIGLHPSDERVSGESGTKETSRHRLEGQASIITSGW